MPNYQDIQHFILEAPRYLVPFEYTNLWHLIHYQNDNELSEYIPRIEETYGRINNLNFHKIYQDIKNMLNDISKYDDIRVLKSGKIILNDNLPEGLISCNNCGNVWDGNAQCMCLLNDDRWYV